MAIIRLKTALMLTFLIFSGCTLAPNQSQKDLVLTVDTQFWSKLLHLSESKVQGLTASYLLDDAFISIASRLYVIRNAQHQIDLQYYIWNDDFIGRLLLSELLRAADRGVRIRLLIDDQNGVQLDQQLQALLQHPNFQIKIYNPYKYRNFRLLDYILRLKQVNRRMHNKLLVADGVIAVTGGRNISSEYFDASEHFQFTDLDVLFYGEAVRSANQVVQSFWNDSISYSAQQLIEPAEVNALMNLRELYKIPELNEEAIQKKLEIAQQLLHQQLNMDSMQWVKAYFVADHPNKTRAQVQPEQLVYTQIQKIMGQPEQQIKLVSAYFVPTQQGTDYLISLAKNNVRVSILTNSFSANDVALVHAFYKNYRQELLKNGVELYEFKPFLYRNEKTWYEVITGNMIPAKGKHSSSLHAKFFNLDNKIFVGSFNFDPRSAVLNTEVGLIMQSDLLQNNILRKIDDYLPQIAYQLKLNQHGEIIWLEHTSQGVITHHIEPETKGFQRFMMNFIAKTPFEALM